MKLYTEEQVRDCMSKSFAEGVCFGASPMYKNESFDEIIKLQCPIELPNDEEIENRIKTHNPYPKQKQMHIDWSNGFERGAKWVIEQIKQDKKL